MIQLAAVALGRRALAWVAESYVMQRAGDLISKHLGADTTQEKEAANQKDVDKKPSVMSNAADLGVAHVAGKVAGAFGHVVGGKMGGEVLEKGVENAIQNIGASPIFKASLNTFNEALAKLKQQPQFQKAMAKEKEVDGVVVQPQLASAADEMTNQRRRRPALSMPSPGM